LASLLPSRRWTPSLFSLCGEGVFPPSYEKHKPLTFPLPNPMVSPSGCVRPPFFFFQSPLLPPPPPPPPSVDMSDRAHLFYPNENIFSSPVAGPSGSLLLSFFLSSYFLNARGSFFLFKTVSTSFYPEGVLPFFLGVPFWWMFAS